MATYTVFARFPEGFVEEVDVQANGYEEARTKAEAVLTEGYLPGWEIIEIIERPTAPGWTVLY